MSVLRFKAVVFDLDGTLLDTLADLADAGLATLAGEGLPGHPVDAFRYFVGDGVDKLVERMLPPDRRDSATVARLVPVYQGHYRRNWDHKTRPYPGVPAMLADLAGRGLTLAVFSNKPDEFTKLTVARFLPGIDFKVVRGARPDTPKKPDPTGARAVAAEMGLPPAEFLYLGDTATDMRTAVGAGMYPVGALWGFREREELLAGGARALVAHPRELAGLVA